MWSQVKKRKGWCKIKIIELLNKIAKGEEIPQELYYNGDYGELTNENDFINYLFYNKEDKFDMYWLVDHNLINLDDEVVVGKVKVKEMR